MFPFVFEYLEIMHKYINISLPGATTQHALEHGFRTVLVEDAARGVSLEDINATRDRLKRSGAAIVRSEQVCRLKSINKFLCLP